MAAAPQGPIEASKFLQHVQERKKKRILFKGEFLMIKKSGETHRTDGAQLRENMDKNQYPDILPFDYNRVVLKLVPGDAHSDYINASYVDGLFESKTFVVTQSVKTKASCVDLWRTVWELKSNCIVMLTKVFDFMRVMCLQYWPLTDYVFGDIQVETLETKTYAHFIIRTLKLVKSDSDEPSAFLELRRRVRKHVKQNPCEGPTIIHCSNGAGRSGAYVAVDQNLELLEREGTLDVFGYAKMLSNCRQGLIESVSEWNTMGLEEFALCDYEPAFPLLTTRTSMYKSKKTRQAVETQDIDEYKMLCHLTPALRIGDCAGGHRLENRAKNRDVMVVPPDHSRPYLSTLHGESKDYTYINAVYVDGFTRKSEESYMNYVI